MIKIPFINPIKYHEIEPDNLPQYMSKHFEKWRFSETLKDWQYQVDYGQLWQTNDIIWQQFISDVPFYTIGSPVLQQVIDSTGNVLFSRLVPNVLEDVDNPGTWVYEDMLLLSGLDLPNGLYFLKITAGGGDVFTPKVLISEPLCIAETVQDSVLLEYKHSSFYGDVFFETGYFPSIRVLGTLRMKNPASKDTLYEDQELNETLLWSYPFEVWELIVGGAPGIPDYLIRRLNRMFGCNTVMIDGKQYTKSEGARWEERALENYPLRAWSIELRETVATASVSFE